MLHAPVVEDRIAAPAVRKRAGRVAVTAVLSAMALVVVDASIVNVALPTIAETLDVTPAMSVRVVSIYQTALVMALLPAAAVGESLGYRRVFSAGLILFIAASASCAVAPSLNWLVAGRFVQGLGGAAIMALGVALLRQALPVSRLGAAIGWNAVTVALSSAAGPTIGALIISFASWHWLFLVHLPLGMVALVASRVLPSIAGSNDKLDLPSIALSAGGFATLILGVESLTGAQSLAALCFAAATSCFVVLVRREMPKASPMIPIDLLRERSFRLSVIASICCFAGQSSGMLAMPFYIQQTLGQTPFMTGLYMTPWPAAVAVAAVVSGRLADRYASAPLSAAGGTLLGLGLAAAAFLPVTAPLLALTALTLLCGVGFGIFQVPNNRNMFLSAPVTRSGAAGGMQGTARLIGQTAGATLVGILFANAIGPAGPKLAFTLGAAFAFAAASVGAWQSLAKAVDSDASLEGER